jgi:hypothetical protein
MLSVDGGTDSRDELDGCFLFSGIGVCFGKVDALVQRIALELLCLHDDRVDELYSARVFAEK